MPLFAFDPLAIQISNRECRRLVESDGRALASKVLDRLIELAKEQTEWNRTQGYPTLRDTREILCSHIKEGIEPDRRLNAGQISLLISNISSAISRVEKPNSDREYIEHAMKIAQFINSCVPMTLSSAANFSDVSLPERP